MKLGKELEWLGAHQLTYSNYQQSTKQYQETRQRVPVWNLIHYRREFRPMTFFGLSTPQLAHATQQLLPKMLICLASSRS